MERKRKQIGPSHQTEVRVTYHDTDQMGHVYYAKYLVWFEIGRNELLRSMGRRYREWEDKHGIFLPVRSCWADYVKSARYDDLVTVRTSVSDISKASITFFYEILLSETGDLLATGGTRHAFITRDGRITRSAMALLPELFESTSRVKSSSQR